VDIAPTIEITEQMVEMTGVPEALCPKLAVRDIKEVVGRVTSNSIPQGCPVVQSLLAPKGTLPGLAARIRDGYRAIAVKVDESIGVAGWVKPGSHVDVIAVMQGKAGSKQEVISRVILQNVEVLAVGQDIGNTGETAAAVPKSVTLLVPPDDAPKLHLAATKGTLRLAMRNQYDSSPLRESTTTDNEILGLSNTTANEATRSSFWSGFFGKLPKLSVKATDKPVTAKPKPAPQEAVALMPQPGWVVEVVNSGRTAELFFTRPDKKGSWMDPSKWPSAPPSGAGKSNPVEPRNVIHLPEGAAIPQAEGDDDGATTSQPAEP
jgi:Flp pilus assembly protein CpaB